MSLTKENIETIKKKIEIDNSLELEKDQDLGKCFLDIITQLKLKIPEFEETIKNKIVNQISLFSNVEEELRYRMGNSKSYMGGENFRNFMFKHRDRIIGFIRIFFDTSGSGGEADLFEVAEDDAGKTGN